MCVCGLRGEGRKGVGCVRKGGNLHGKKEGVLLIAWGPKKSNLRNQEGDQEKEKKKKRKKRKKTSRGKFSGGERGEQLLTHCR